MKLSLPPLTFWLWFFCFGGPLGALSAGGLVACHLPEFVAWPLGCGFGFAGWWFAYHFKQTNQAEYLLLGLMAIVLATASDGMNLLNQVRQASLAPAQVAASRAKMAAETVSAAQAAVSDAQAAAESAERLLAAARSDMDVERSRGGAGSRWDGLKLAADRQAAEVAVRRAAVATERERLAAALRAASVESVTAAETEGGMHVLALAPWWVLFAASGLLELVAAGMGYCEPRRAVAAVVESRPLVESAPAPLRVVSLPVALPEGREGGAGTCPVERGALVEDEPRSRRARARKLGRESKRIYRELGRELPEDGRER